MTRPRRRRAERQRAAVYSALGDAHITSPQKAELLTRLDDDEEAEVACGFHAEQELEVDTRAGGKRLRQRDDSCGEGGVESATDCCVRQRGVFDTVFLKR